MTEKNYPELYGKCMGKLTYLNIYLDILSKSELIVPEFRVDLKNESEKLNAFLQEVS